jgi:predicted nucleic acid-binding protein
MRVFIDTSILYPALDPNHPGNAKILPLMKELETNHSIVVLNTHLIAELFNNLSKKPRLRPEELIKAGETITNISERYETVELTKHDYLTAVQRCIRLGLRGAVIYDALHFQAAIKAKVDVFYTANFRDFARLLDDDISFEIESAL